MKMGIFCGQRRKARAKEVFVRKKRLWVKFVKLSANEIFLIRDKDVFFQLMQSHLIKKNYFSAHRGNNFLPH